MTKNLRIFLDFDGTITQKDSLQAVLDHFVGPEWWEIENRVTAGELDEKTALQAEFALMRVPLEPVLKFVDETVKIDETFHEFDRFCQDQSIPLTILSGGLDIIIKRILEDNNLDHIPFFSNGLEVDAQNNWSIIQNNLPKIKNLCNHCKTNHLIQAQESGTKVIYIGDGNTDRCPAMAADWVFATGSLQRYLEENRKPFFPFKKFADIVPILEELCCKSSVSTTA